jgi:hypothetical protein
MSLNLVMTEGKSEDKVSEQAIREELSRVLQSSMFAQSDRLGRFLRFTVETTLAGDADTLKEYLIGTEVYERNSSYHPSEDSIVRSEARRLRAKLKEYYDSVGKYDSVHIYYRPGSYVPAFRPRPSEGGEHMLPSAKPVELLLRFRRNVLTENNNGVEVEIQARVTNDQAQDEKTASYAYNLLQRLASFAANNTTSLEPEFTGERVSIDVPKPIQISSCSTRTTEGRAVRAVISKVDRMKIRQGQVEDTSAIRKMNFRRSASL